MDDEAKQLLREIRDLQLEQLELMRQIHSGVPAWFRWKFSVFQMLAAMTAIAIILGLMVLLSG